MFGRGRPAMPFRHNVSEGTTMHGCSRTSLEQIMVGGLVEVRNPAKTSIKDQLSALEVQDDKDQVRA